MFPTWAGAAALLLLEDRPMHYDELNHKMFRRGLSGLGSRGGRTPERSLCSILSTRDDIFQRTGGGHYQISSGTAALRENAVQGALWRVVTSCSQRHDELLRAILAERIDIDERVRVREEIEEIEKYLHQASRLYTQPAWQKSVARDSLSTVVARRGHP